MFTTVERRYIRRKLTGVMLCAPCGVTLENYADGCCEHDHRRCPAWLAIDAAYGEAQDITEADLITQ